MESSVTAKLKNPIAQKGNVTQKLLKGQTWVSLQMF
jgi:hypothetical protein